MAGQQSATVATLRDPSFVFQSSRYPARRLYYKPFVLPEPYHRAYLLVVVAYDRDGKKGTVVTAFPTANIKQEDILLWSKYNTTE